MPLSAAAKYRRENRHRDTRIEGEVWRRRTFREFLELSRLSVEVVRIFLYPIEFGDPGLEICSGG